MRLVLLDQAKKDIANIADYIAEQGKSSRAGKDFARRLYAKCKELPSIKGTIGVERPELRAGLRTHPFGSYVIFSCTTMSALKLSQLSKDTGT